MTNFRLMFLPSVDSIDIASPDASVKPWSDFGAAYFQVPLSSIDRIERAERKVVTVASTISSGASFASTTGGSSQFTSSATGASEISFLHLTLFCKDIRVLHFRLHAGNDAERASELLHTMAFPNEGQARFIFAFDHKLSSELDVGWGVFDMEQELVRQRIKDV